jgi:LmbE family N-acetylglucosaminyl deacetylase
MTQLIFPPGLQRILCLGAHSDDLEIGCGGAMLRLLQTYGPLRVDWVVFSASGPRAEEAQRAASLFLAGAAEQRVHLKSFRDGFFPYQGAAIKEYFEALKQDLAPDLIFTHYRHDLHQDHRLINELTWNTFRRHLILEYEIPKYDGDLGTPNVFMHLDEETAHRKVEYLMRSFATQRSKHWFTEDLFLGLLRLRGMEAGGQTHYAEAFYGRKLSI